MVNRLVDRAALANELDGALPGFRQADGLDDDVGAAAVGEVPHGVFQVRAILGSHFHTLEAVPGGYRVDLTDSTHTAEDAEQAYAKAVIHLLGA